MGRVPTYGALLRFAFPCATDEFLEFSVDGVSLVNELAYALCVHVYLLGVQFRKGVRKR